MGVILVNVVLMATTFANEAPAFTSGALARATGTQAHTQQTSCACAHPLDLQPRQLATLLSAWCCCWSWLQSWLLRARASTSAATGTSELGSGAARPGLCWLASLQAQQVHLGAHIMQPLPRASTTDSTWFSVLQQWWILPHRSWKQQVAGACTWLC